MNVTAGPSASLRPQLRRISAIGFDWRAEVSLKETLALLGGKTTDRWQYTEDLVADVLVYDAGNALAQAVVRRQIASGHPCICIPSTGDAGDELVLRYPFGATRLIRCLDYASTRLTGQSAATGDGSDSVCQRLDVAMRTPGAEALVLRSGNHEGLLWVASQRIAWPVSLDLDECARILAGDVEIEVLHRGDAKLKSTAAGAALQSAEPLLWAIGIARSGGHPLRRLPAGQRYRLRRWPDFGVIGRRSADLRCAALLMQRALSGTELASFSGLPIGVVQVFLNAAALCGVLVADAERVVMPARGAASGRSPFGSVLHRIRSAFAMTSAA
ncbi:hypothetical protein [Solimonas marina]|uniref:Uncharacterized protein n=1 Tax=Solimonas marina TaxID=2714601 RepID=A0A969W581_9GAMM|nr:hypothetical protein [Solimonas marina]NKF20807.1 hypothetical protein [Solimonas marina]